jgi:hypothetical protein
VLKPVTVALGEVGLVMVKTAGVLPNCAHWPVSPALGVLPLNDTGLGTAPKQYVWLDPGLAVVAAVFVPTVTVVVAEVV